MNEEINKALPNENKMDPICIECGLTYLTE